MHHDEWSGSVTEGEVEPCLNGGYDENGSKSSAETAEKNVDIGKAEATGSPVKEQMKKDVKEASSEDEEKMEDSPVMGLLTELKKTKVQTKKSQVVEKEKIPTESTIKEAVKKRASYLKANSDKITMAGVRLLLAEDLELDKDALYPFKKFISQQVDEVLKSPKFSEPASGVKKKKYSKKFSQQCIQKAQRKRKRPAKETKESSKKRIKLAETSEENSEAGGCASEDDQSHSSAEKPVKKKEVATPAYGKRVEHLKSVIKSLFLQQFIRESRQASENKREAFLIKELEEILSREGMSTDPSEKEIKEVRKRKDRAKELEGIDMSNIVSSTRRRSTTSFVATPKPKIPVESDGNKAEDTETSNSEGDGDNDNDDDDDDAEDGDDSQSEEFNEGGGSNGNVVGPWKGGGGVGVSGCGGNGGAIGGTDVLDAAAAGVGVGDVATVVPTGGVVLIVAAAMLGFWGNGGGCSGGSGVVSRT
ncbi:hypothetical protein Acr_11g0009510 [Actinidia rufa]|uniref:Histone chaperone domain-containing protein n=1 Tax=Actinidia rufa TaxID=165716 RepID=A0A7J0FD98_9ERIC|nr:hypothetical protein Acr_11g0009510 [Actinidia rufa]